MTRISNRASDKLRALLNCDHVNPSGILAPTAVDACATWFAGLTETARDTANTALGAYREGDQTGAQAIAAKLPGAPKFPS